MKIDVNTIQDIRLSARSENVLQFEYAAKNGVIHTAVLTIPENPEDNKTYKAILDKFGEERLAALHDERKERIEHARIAAEVRKESNEQARMMAVLFNKKERAFEQFWIDAADDDVKMAVRCAPSIECVDALVNNEYVKYMNKYMLNNVTMMEKQDDYMYE